MLDFEPYPGYFCDHIYGNAVEIFVYDKDTKNVLHYEKTCIKCKNIKVEKYEGDHV